MNKKDKFNKKPNTMPLGFCFPPKIRVDGSNYYVEGICTPTEKGTQYGDILLSNGDILENVNPKTDLRGDMFNILLANGTIEYQKDRNGNYLNQDQESRELRDAEKIIEELNIELNQAKMKLSRMAEESKADDFIGKETKKMGNALSNIRGSEQYNRDIIRRIPGQFQSRYPEETEDDPESNPIEEESKEEE